MAQIIFTRLQESYSSLRLFFFLCLLKSSQTFGIKIAGGKKQPIFWLQYTIVGGEPDPMAWFP